MYLFCFFAANLGVKYPHVGAINCLSTKCQINDNQKQYLYLPRG